MHIIYIIYCIIYVYIICIYIMLDISNVITKWSLVDLSMKYIFKYFYLIKISKESFNTYIFNISSLNKIISSFFSNAIPMRRETIDLAGEVTLIW